MIKAYQVGGCIRDRLLGLVSKDIDYAVEAPSYSAMIDWIKSNGGKIYLEKPEFLTVRAHLPDGEPADYVLCRKDGSYSDGRRPDMVEPGSLIDDLSRRDFTMNAIAFDEATGRYIDPFDGQYHLTNRIIKCVGQPEDRFSEDALRMLRAIRFMITKNMILSNKIIDCLRDPKLLKLLRENISMDRKREEIGKCFKFSTIKTFKTLNMISRDNSTGLLTDIFDAPTGKIWLMPTSKEP